MKKRFVVFHDGGFVADYDEAISAVSRAQVEMLDGHSGVKVIDRVNKEEVPV